MYMTVGLFKSMATIMALSLMVLLFASGCKKDNNGPAENLGLPQIIHFYRDADTVGGVVHIYGKNFSKYLAHNTVIFNSKEATPFYSDNDTLLVKVPAGATTGKISVKVYDNTAVSIDTFYVTTGRWTKLADFPGDGRITTVAFAVNNTGYMGTGSGNSNYLKDFWKYNQSADNWSQLSDFPGGYRREAISFVIGNNVYVGLGTNTNTFTTVNDLYVYNTSADTWIREPDEPFHFNNNPVALAINGKGYIITGSYYFQVAEFDPLIGWNLKANFPGTGRSSATGFVIGNKGYIAGGNSGSSGDLRDLWEYDPSTDTWTEKAAMRHGGYNTTGFSINGKGYVGNEQEFWEYDRVTDTWTRKTDFPGSTYIYRVSFVLNNVAYVACGLSSSNETSKEVWKFEP
jgi:N-acetylneuraminic acid mutarotase